MNLPARTLIPGCMAFALAAGASEALHGQRVLYQGAGFTVTDTSVRQGRFEAVATSRDTIVSTYPRSGREIRYRFSINGQDNEFRPGTEHTLYVRPQGGAIVSPVHVFGDEPRPYFPTPEASAGSDDGIAQVTLRLDMRGVLRSLRETGSYRPPQGTPIGRDELHAVYAIGDADGLSWDVGGLRPGSPAELTDPDGDGIYTATLPVQTRYTRARTAEGAAIWARTADVSAFPQLRSDQRLVDALYRMSLEELTQLVRADGALSAGAKWEGVWTRDVSYASVLALALAAPDAVRRSLLAKVDSEGRIIQDTGTGGSWPVSTDRMTWALAAWELYAATGDRAWLRRSYDVIRRSAAADRHAAFEARTGLVAGETSFMDWREQSYPRWMEPRDIASSAAVGTNVVHYATYRILGKMARALGQPAAEWDGTAERIRTAINTRLWLPEQGWYSVYRYGRGFPTLSPRSDGLGEALAIIYGVPSVERGATLAARTPQVAFGTPTFWPYVPNLPSYHDGALWPFVNAYWAWASARAGNTAGVEHALASIYRPAALFLTNKENMVAATGHFDGTVLNSDRQLWSVAGNLAATYRVLFGMRLEADRLSFRPMVPPAYGGTRTLTGLRYRNAVLAVTVAGHGDGVASARLDGRPVALADVPATLAGAHTLVIRMNGRWPAARIHLVQNHFAPETPVARMKGDSLEWTEIPGAVRYATYRNGRTAESTTGTRVAVAASGDVAEYQVMAVDASGAQSFLSEPVRIAPAGTEIVARPDVALETEHAGFTGAGYVLLTLDRNTTVHIPVHVACAGTYEVAPRYANGSGPINTDSKAAVRTLLVDGRPAGVLVMPQRGAGQWTDWGYGTAVRTVLGPGEHTLSLTYTPLDQNMGRTVNTALLDHLRLTRIGPALAPARGCR
ncbi:MAG: glycogen debranching protein [Gemmatimonadetes bacterium]|nr:glycogen debranching protein [Gemmatimonadota bacterium]